MIFKEDPEARQELRDIIDWYNEERPGPGGEFLNSYELALSAIVKAPHVWPNIGKRTRRYQTSRFPYKIIYAASDDEVKIIAVVHNRRRPGYWRSRLKH